MEGKQRKNKRGQKKKKVELVFDPEARREFLTGFRKRKLERKAKFQEELQKKLKEERKRIREAAKESYKTMVKSHSTIPEIEHLLKEEHDLGTHSVEIVELSSQALAKENNWIGANNSSYAVKEEPSKEENDGAESEVELVPGMGLKRKVKKKIKQESKSEDEEEEEDKGPVFNSAKELKKVIKKEATRSVKKSKVYQMKNKLDKIKSRKKSQTKNKRISKIKEGGKKGKRIKRANAIRGSKQAMGRN
ncbi:nucleolar protein 12 [Thrips palmi]|uniref:Nucleolar protein 12 n=1 Tax=Thrips palmi TaxID=161013 RepID=A0A6P8ZUK3_THRPL|nr:nucleolar protein 12 [Thrips palmi]